MTQHYISNSLVAKFMQKVQQKVDADGTLTRDEFSSMMREVIDEHKNYITH